MFLYPEGFLAARAARDYKDPQGASFASKSLPQEGSEVGSINFDADAMFGGFETQCLPGPTFVSPGASCGDGRLWQETSPG